MWLSDLAYTRPQIQWYPIPIVQSLIHPRLKIALTISTVKPPESIEPNRLSGHDEIRLPIECRASHTGHIKRDRQSLSAS